MLGRQIETDLYCRQGRALTNFDRTLPVPDSDLARQAFRDPYCVGFLPMSAAAGTSWGQPAGPGLTR